MTEKLKEAVDLLSDTLAQVKTEHPYGCNIGTENRYWIEVLPVAIKVLRTVLEAGSEVPEAFNSQARSNEGFDRSYITGYNAHRQAVLPVVMKKNEIISEQAKRIELQDEYIKLLGDELDEIAPLASVHGWKSSRYEQGKSIRKKIAELNQTVAERGG